jgi:hypothetical protein
MATARWFFDSEPNSRFIIQEHLRQDYWRNGPSQLWVEAVQTTAPYKAVGYWHDLSFELEWVPREYVLLRSNRRDDELIRVTTLQLGFKPLRVGEEEGRYVVEWRPRGVIEMPPEPVGATPVINVKGE